MLKELAGAKGSPNVGKLWGAEAWLSDRRLRIFIGLVIISILAALVPGAVQGSGSVFAKRDSDGTTAAVSWTRYAGEDFSYYRVIVCDDSQYDGGSCSGTVFRSDAIRDAGNTGPVTVTGLDPHTGYGVILQTWHGGESSVIKLHNTLPALPDPDPTPVPTEEPTPVPTKEPSKDPTPVPTEEPSEDPTPEPTQEPSSSGGLTFGGATVANQSYFTDEAINTLTLPRASRTSDGASATVGAITYSLSPSLPAGLSFDAANRTISGTPTAASASASYSYSASDGTDTATLVFNIKVAEDLVTTAEEEGATGQANQAPRTIASTHDTHNQVTGSDNDCYHNHSVSPPNGYSSYFEDPDGDTLTITSSSSHPGLVAITQHSPVRIRANHPADTWVTITTTATDPGGLTADFVWKYKMTCTTNSSMSVNENSPAGTNVGKAGLYNSGASNWTIEGDAASSFTISKGWVKVKSGASLDYETKNSYNGTVKYDVVSGGTTYKSSRAVTVTINNLGGPVMSAPTVTRDSAAPTTKLDISWSAPSVSNNLTDYDVRYTQTGGSWATHAFTGTGTSTERPGLTAGKKYEVQVRGTDAEGTGSWSGSGTAITQYTTQTRNVAENSAAGTNVGAAVDADSNPNGHTLSYSLSGTDASSFSINSSTGQITVGSGTSLDYETKTSYSVIVTMAASGGNVTSAGNTGLSPNGTGNYVIPVTINVTNINEGPEFADATATRSIAENSTAGTSIGAAVTAGADPEGDALTYSLTGTDASKLDIGASTGQISVKTGNVPNYEVQTSYSVTVNVSDKKAADGTANTAIDDTIAVTVNVTDVTEPPSAPSAPTVAANTTTPTTKLDVTWSAPTNTGPAISDYDVRYRLSGTTNWTEWDASTTSTTRKVTITGLTVGKSYDAQVRAESDEGTSGWSATGSGTTNSNAVTRSVAENSAAGTNVGAAVTASANTNGYTLTHSLSGTDASSFTIESSSGQIKVKSALDYETKSSYVVVVTVKAAVVGVQSQSFTLDPNAPGDYDVSVTINVTDKNDTPTFDDGATTSRSVAENSASGANVGSAVTASDQDGDTLTYSLSGTDASKFNVGTSTGQITVASGTSLDYETKSSYSVTVNVSDKKNADGTADTVIDDTIAVTINVTDEQYKPAKVTGVSASAKTSSPIDTIVLTWDEPLDSSVSAGKTADPDYRNVEAFWISYKKKTTASWINAPHTVVKDGTATSTDITGLDVNTTYQFRIKAWDDSTYADYTRLSPEWSDIADGSTVSNLDPAFPSDTATRSIAENSSAGTNVGAAVTATDPYLSTDTLYYTLTGTDASKFDIGLNTGQITVKTGNIPNYEAKTSYSVTVGVSDRKASNGTADTVVDDTIAITISVTDVNEPPAAPAAPSVSANTTTPTTKIDVSWTAPTMTGKPAITDYDVQYRKNGDSSWTSHSFTGTGTSTTLSGLTEGKSYEVQVRAVNDEGNGSWSASGSAITDASAMTRNIAENSAAGSNVGAAVTATSNPNGYTLTHAMSGTDASKFSIDSSTGQITVGTGTTLNYESGTTSYSVVVTVTAAVAGITTTSLNPNAPGAYTVPVTINVTDVNEPPPKMNKPTLTRNSSSPKTKMDASWTALTNTQMTGKPAVTDYDVQYNDETVLGESDHSFTGTGTSTTISSLSAGTHYQVRVRASNDEGTGPWSDWSDGLGTHSNTATRSVAENSAAGTKIGAEVTPQGQPRDYPPLPHTLSGTDASKFSVDNKGQITVKSGTSLDYESGVTSYSVVVEANYYYMPVTINVTDVNEPPAAPAAPTVAQNTTTPKTKLDVSWTAPTMTGKPAITDYDVQYKKKSATGWTSHSFTGTGTSTAITGLTPNTTYVVQVKAINDEGNSGWSNSGEATTKANTPAAFAKDTDTRSIAENSAANANIGAVVTATDADGDALTYSLTGTDASSFDIDSSTGQITVATGTTLDYEATTSYSVTVNVTDKKKADGTADTAIDDTIAVTISVTDVNEPPAAPAAPSVSPNSTTPATKIDVSWAAPDVTGKPAISGYGVQYRLSGDSNWTSHSFSGTGTSTNITGLTEGKSYEVQVRATNAEGTGAWSDSGAAITDANAVTRSVAENSAAGTNVGAAVTATSNPNNYTLTHSLSGTDASKFSIGASTGQITVGTGTSLDYETKTSYSVVVTVTAAAAGITSASLDPNGPGDYTVPVTINVTDVSESPEFPADTATRSVAENSAAGTNVGAAVTATDPDGDTVEYSLAGTDAGKFDIDSATGQITVGTGTSLDHEANVSYSVTVNATDNKNDSGASDPAVDDTIAVTISVTDVNEPPPAPAAPSVSQNTSSPKTSLDLSWTAPDVTGKPAITGYDVQYRLSGGSNWTSHAFTGVGTSTTLTGLTAGRSYEAQVRAVNDEGNGAWSGSGTAITQAGAVTLSLAENSAAGTNVGAPVTASSNPNNYDLTHALSGTDAGKFEIVSATGQIRVKTGTDLNYEAKTSYSVVVTVRVATVQSSSLTPNAPGAYVVPVTINLTDVNEPPAAPDSPLVSRNASSSKTSLDVSWTAPDMTGKPAITDYDVQYKKTSESTWSSHSFAGAGTSTTLTGLTGGVRYEVQVMARNDEGDSPWSISGSAETQDKNLNSQLDDATRSVDENSVGGTAVGAPVTATDTEGNTLTYSISGASEFTIDSATGQIEVASGADLDHESKSSYTVTVSVSDGRDSENNPDNAIDDTSTVTIDVNDVDEPPAKMASPAVTVNPDSSTSQLDVSWTTPTMTGKPAIIDYDVRFKDVDGSVWISLDFTGTHTSASLTGLEAGEKYEAQVRATNDEGSGEWSDSGIAKTQAGATNEEQPNPLNRAPAFSTPGSLSVPENSSAGTKVGSPLTATDPDGDSLTYSLSGAASSKFEIDSTGQIKVSAGANLDYESDSSYSVEVGVSDGADAFGIADKVIDDTVTVTINVTDVNEPPPAPVAPTLSRSETTLSVSWTAPSMTGRPAIDDYDVQYRQSNGEWQDYAFSGTATSAAIAGVSAEAGYEARVRASNDEGTGPWSAPGTLAAQNPSLDSNRLANTAVVSRSLNPRSNDDPQISGPETFTVNENSPAGTNVGTPVASDPDGDALIWSIDGTGEFTIDSATGRIIVAKGANLDYETVRSYTVMVNITDGLDDSKNEDPNADDSTRVTILVADVSEPPAKPGAPLVAVDVDSPTSGLTAEWTAPANYGPPIASYELRYRAEGVQDWTSREGRETGLSARISGLESATTYEVQVRAVNDEGASPWSDSGKGFYRGRQQRRRIHHGRR